jgi:hypothetical protein
MRSEFDPRDLIHWSGHEELGLQFMRLLGVAQEGGATVSECFVTASRIDLRKGILAPRMETDRGRQLRARQAGAE